MQKLWDSMEASESSYEAALVARLAALEKAAREKKEARRATAALKADFEKGVHEWSEWTRGKQDTFAEGAAASGAAAARLLGSTPGETNQLLGSLRKGFRPGEKPARAAQLVELRARRAALEPRLTAEALEDAAQLKKEASRHASVQLSGLQWAESLLADKAARRAFASNEFRHDDSDNSGTLNRGEVIGCIKDICSRFELALPRDEKVGQLLDLCDKVGCQAASNAGPAVCCHGIARPPWPLLSWQRSALLPWQSGDGELQESEFRATAPA